VRKTFQIRSGSTIVATITVEADEVRLGGDYPADDFIRAFDDKLAPVFCGSLWHRNKSLKIIEAEGAHA
jgi:hypothetical protein